MTCRSKTCGSTARGYRPSRSRFIISKVDNILIPNPSNPYTMVVQWNELFPFAGSSPYGEQYPHPRHVLQAAFRSDPSKLKAHPNWRAPVGHGPYKVVEWTSGSHITLEAYDKFPLGAPAFKRLTFRFILDSTVLQANQIAGNVDGTEINNFGCLSMEQIEQRHRDLARDLGVIPSPELEEQFKRLRQIAAGVALVGEVSDRLRARVLARDVSIAMQVPQDTSINNILNARIEEVRDEGPDKVMVRMTVGESQALLARITRRSREERETYGWRQQLADAAAPVVPDGAELAPHSDGMNEASQRAHG